ncbi:MAG: hypothetical protein ACXWJA_05285, partial [Caldimonas sp.]
MAASGIADTELAAIAAAARAGVAARGVEPAPSGAAYSRFVQRIRRRYPAELAELGPGLPGRESITRLVERLRREGRDLASALRVARQLTLERLAVLDTEAEATLADVTSAMTELAEATVEIALAQALVEQDARFGAPLNAAGERI